MCGICGVIGGDPVVVAPAVSRMMGAMVHRGPDDQGYEELPLTAEGQAAMGTADRRHNVGNHAAADGHRGGSRAAAGMLAAGCGGYPVAGFGFRRLSILDLTSAGHQPMFNPTTGDCLVFNGEIYNYRRLRAELQCEGVLFRSNCDSEVLLQALSRWGESALHKIQGMYALAFYDARNRRVLLARDPLGIKPLYVSRERNRVVFASEVRAIKASQLVDLALDETGVASMLAYGSVQSPLTVYRAIRSFPAGHFQWIDAAGGGGVDSHQRRYWWFPPVAPKGIELTGAIASVRQLLRDSVMRHLVSDVPVGVFLSAGVDSTIVASLAREYTAAVTAFTVGFGKAYGTDEVDLAVGTAKALGVKHVAVELDTRNVTDLWRAWIERMDSPSVDGFNTHVVSWSLAREGVVVGLSGLGADELFGGYNTFERAPRLSRILRALRFVPPALRAGLVSRFGALMRSRAVIDKLTDVVAGDPDIVSVTRALRRTVSNQRLAAMGLPTGAEVLRAAPGQVRPGGDEESDGFNTVARTELTHYMSDTLLRDTDVNSMRHSLEVRVPYLDLPLVEYVSALPGRLKWHEGVASKSLLRMAFKDTLRDDIAGRPKTGFTLPIGDWMRGEMRETCAAAINRVARIPFLEEREVRSMWDAFLANDKAMHWSRPMSLVVLGACID